jgi:hypothetical protein
MWDKIKKENERTTDKESCYIFYVWDNLTNLIWICVIIQTVTHLSFKFMKKKKIREWKRTSVLLTHEEMKRCITRINRRCVDVC